MIIKLIYKLGVSIASKLGMYIERNINYTNTIRRELKYGVTLDAGCGTGKITKQIAKKHHGVIIALDLSFKALRTIKDDKILCICADAHAIPLRNKSINNVVSTSLIEHLRKPEEHLQEASRILKPGGKLIIQIPNLNYFIEPHTKFPLLSFLPSNVKYKVLERLNYPYINFEITIKKIINQMIKYNLTPVKIIKYYHKIRTPPWPPSWIIIAVRK